MRRSMLVAWLAASLVASAVATLACGRIGYDANSGDAAAGAGGGGSAGGVSGTGGASGFGGASGTGGVSGTGGTAAGSGGTAGAAGSASDAGPDGSIPCPSMSFGGHLYLFCDGTLDWPAARTACEARGTRLVRIDDDAENNWVVANATFGPTSQRLGIWIGGYEPTADGDWRWTDGDAFWLGQANGVPVGGLYTNWDRREPNNAVGPEACASIPLNVTTWYDYDCTDPQYFVCEAY
jgi:hypothetical protein